MNGLAIQLACVTRGRSLAGGAIPQRRVSCWPIPRSPVGSNPQTAVTRAARVEAVLFLSREALSTRRIAQLANLTDATEARTLLGELSAGYERRGAAFQIENIAGGYRLLTRPQFAPWIGKIAPPPGDVELTPSALDTLAVVAYRQPVLRAEVEAIRGVASGEFLRQLIERDLLRIVGRSEELGRPLLYGTTKRFLQVFGLKNLDDLPRAESLRGNTSEQTAPPRQAA